MSYSISEPDVVTVEYEIVGASEHSGGYSAENILVDKPRDQSSRWSGVIVPANTKQWIRLRLKRTCVLKTITFGKFFKSHPCNMKDFKVLVGLTEASMTEVLQGSVRNDSTSEIFSIKSTNRVGMPYPTRFVEIVPLTSHGQSFNTSIWHVSLSGIAEESYVEHIRQRHQEYREHASLRQILKHLRQRRFLTPVSQILARSGLQLEHPLITSLHEAFVLNGNWAESEKLFLDCAKEGLLRSYRYSCQTYTRWTRIRGMDPDGDVPCRRSGHSMCIDEQNGVIYLFGGWDGRASLDDLWVYDITQDTWRLLSLATSRDKNGPGPRSCHKMVFDQKTGCIYVLGRMCEGDGVEVPRARSLPVPDPREGSGSREPPLPWVGTPTVSATSPPELSPGHASIFHAWPSHCSEFFRYHTRGLDAGKWDLLTFDTASSGGPPLIYDHQMAIDSEAQVIYVSGGRVVEPEYDVFKFSGLYSYDIRTSKWKMYNTSDSYASHPHIPPRWGHSMVFDPKSQTLFIFAGQREELRFLPDMYAFHIPTNTVTELFSNFTAAGGPDPCFTQRAVIDPEKREIYVVCGLTRTKSSITPTLDADSFWVYRYERPELPGKWSKILPGKDEVTIPQPRYAHQVVYHPTTGGLYMHGGNAGLGIDEDEGEGDARSPSSEGGRDVRGRESSREHDTEKRLDDFWQLDLIRPSNEEIVRRALYEIRQQQFREMCEDGPPIKALTFLQTRVSSVVDHGDPDEANVFRSLLSAHLLAAPARTGATSGSATPTSASMVAMSAGDHGRTDTPPPRKRSRPSSPDPATGVSSSSIPYDEDPLETGGHPPSPERYRQRTQMFERLLAFVDEEAKQPDQNLMEILSGDGLMT